MIPVSMMNSNKDMSELRMMVAIDPSDAISHNMQNCYQNIDHLDPDERHDQSAEAVNQGVVAQHHRRAEGPVFHAAKGQGYQEDDDQRVKDHRGQHGALRSCQAHDVERSERRINGNERSGKDG